MDFPGLELVQFTPRDLVGPGVEIFRRHLSNTALGTIITINIPSMQTSKERLYLVQFAARLAPAAIVLARGTSALVRFTSVTDINYFWRIDATQPATAGLQKVFSSRPFVLPGGIDWVFEGLFDSIGATDNQFDLDVLGFSFPKGNVLV